MDRDEADTRGDELPPGSVLCAGQYVIDRYLSAGGFGVTYLARDSLGRRVVIKECFPGALCFRANQTVRVRSQGSAVEFDAILELFEKEARALAALQHPYIVGVHQYFRDNGTAYMAMDYVRGRTLLDIIETHPARLTPEMVRMLLTRLLQAVAFIHRHDLLHRDISPDNILIDDDDTPVLIDFGAAREDATRVSRALSKVMTVKDGYSPQEFYLSGSEQVFASDLYALAATFHHVLTGRAPASSQSRMSAAVRDAPDPLAPLGDVPGHDAAFLAAIGTCLNLFPRDRLQTADQWLEAIDADLRRKRLLQVAERDRSLDRTVAQLVKDFFKDFQPIKTGGVADPVAGAPGPGGAGAGAAARKMPGEGPGTRLGAPSGARAPVHAQAAPHDQELEQEQEQEGQDRDQEDGEQGPTGRGPGEPDPGEGGRGALGPQGPCAGEDPDAADGDLPVPRRPVRPRAARTPHLQPIDRIKLKYRKPPPPPEPVPDPRSSLLSGWVGRLGRTSRPERPAGGKTDSSEELA